MSVFRGGHCYTYKLVFSPFLRGILESTENTPDVRQFSTKPIKKWRSTETVDLLAPANCDPDTGGLKMLWFDAWFGGAGAMDEAEIVAAVGLARNCFTAIGLTGKPGLPLNGLVSLPFLRTKAAVAGT